MIVCLSVFALQGGKPEKQAQRSFESYPRTPAQVSYFVAKILTIKYEMM